MPCLAIHLAVAKKYLENHKEENKDDFILGTIAPDINMEDINKYINDIDSSKSSHHFGTNYETTSVIEYMKRKVDFSKFFAQNDINTSFLRAYFLHLLCDYYFFGEYIKDEKFAGLSFQDAVKIGFNDYNLITPKLIKEYELEIPEQIKDMINGVGIGEIKLLDETTVDSFINEMSNLDLQKEKEKYI